MAGDHTTALTKKTLYRGNDTPWKFTYSEDGATTDITGYTFTLTVDTLENPTDPSATQQFQITNTSVDDANALVEFRPSVVNMTLDAGTYFFAIDIQGVATDRRTNHVGNMMPFTICQIQASGRQHFVRPNA